MRWCQLEFADTFTVVVDVVSKVLFVWWLFAYL